MLVLTGMNYANRRTLYDDAKKSLKTFKGDTVERSADSGVSIKLKPAFLAEPEEVLLAAGYIKQSHGERSGRGRNNQGSRQNQAQHYREKLNPVGPDGKILTCRCCGSYRHFIADCPHNPDNMDGLSIWVTDTV